MIPRKCLYRFYPVAHALQLHRQAAGVSAAKVGNAVGVGKDAIIRYEKAQQMPTNSTLVELAKFFGLPDEFYVDLLSDAPAEETSLAEASLARVQSESLLIHTVSMLPFPALMRVVEYANLLATNIHVDKETPYVADAKQ